MNEAEIAYKILNRRNATSPVVMIGEMQHALGYDGYALAIERRWIEPNYDSGELSVSERQGVLNEMRALAKSIKDPVVESKPNNLYRLFTTNQKQTIVVQTPNGLVESIMEEEDAEIGDEVVVADDGKPYTAVVKSKNSDGTYSLSFGREKPRTDRSYSKAEVRKTAKAPTASGRPTPAVTPQ